MPAVVSRPSLDPNPPSKSGAETASVDNDAFKQALADAGLDPNTVSRRTPDNQRDIADILEDELVADILADDLNDKEALLFAGAFWTGYQSKNVERARSAWRIATFMVKYPTAAASDVPLRLLTDTFFIGYPRPRTSISSLIHLWARAGAFGAAQTRLNAYPLFKWSQHRRNQLAVVVEWERQTCERAEMRRKQRLVKKLKPKGPRS